MRVICIDNKFQEFFLVDGQEYTVVGEASSGSGYYRLKEIPINIYTGAEAAFKKTRFIPLSNID
jgi:hypothetical protein